MSNQTISPGALLAGRYRIAELLTEVDGARTWRAVDEVLGRAVVVDVLPGGDPRAAGLFDAARRAAAAGDARFLRVLDCDEHDGLSYCVREWASGRPLERMLGAGPITGQQAGWLTREVSEALENLHRGGLHHGAINPSTVIVTDVGSIKVIGIATEAVLRSLPSLGSPAEDVRDLGRVLYAALTARWPGSPAYGLQPAPLEHGRLLSPRQVRAGVPRSLDDIADRLLGNPPRHHAAPITSAAGLSAALSGVIGSSHEPPSQLTDETVAIAQQNGSVDDATVVVPAVSMPPAIDPAAPASNQPAPNGAPPVAEPISPAAYQGSRPVRRHGGNGDDGAHGNGGRRRPDQPEKSGGHWGGRILILLAILALLSVIAMAQFLAKGAFRNDQDNTKDAPQTPTNTAPANKTIKITGAKDFDPKPDGNGEEHPEDVGNTYDGKPQTSWTTMSYKKRADFGGTKPGVGIIYDLGSVTEISQVTVTLEGEPTSLELRIPKEDPAKSPGAVDDWAVVSAVEDAGESAELRAEAGTKTRYVMVWLTKLPKDGSGYRGEISEVTVQR